MRVAHRKITAWIVSIALLFVALGPAFARVSSAWAGDVAVWSEICTSQGIVRTEVGAQSAGDTGSSSAHARVNCFCCLTPHLGLALTPAAHSLVPASTSALLPSFAAWLLPRPSVDWSPSQPRGPPAAS